MTAPAPRSKAFGWGAATRGSAVNPIMPKVQAPLRTLFVAMAVMTYLACLAIGALMLINRAVDGWTAQIASEMTVQVRQVAGSDIEAETEKAAGILRSASGVTRVGVLSRADSARLLEPWLGQTRIMDELPIPRLIAVSIDADAPPNLAALHRALDQQVTGATLDTHRVWQDELSRLAGAMRWLGIAVLALIVMASVALVVFAARTALDANHEVIEVLYLVGAKDRFIARQVERRFLGTGLRAAMVGTAGAFATFALIGFSGQFSGPQGLADASSRLLFGPPAATYQSYLMLLAVPLLATFIALVSARTAVLRVLRSMF